MILVNDTEDYGAPEFYVTGTAEIERIGGQIRITYYSRRHDKNVIVCHCIWDAAAFEAVQSGYRKFRMTENRDKFVDAN